MSTYHCSNCREDLEVEDTRKMSIGDAKQDRNLVFCKKCNVYLRLEESAKPAQE